MAGFVIRLPLLYSVHMNSRVCISHKKQSLGSGEGFTSVEFRPDCSGKQGGVCGGC